MNTEYEWSIWKETALVSGIDEAGRGPLAGPVVAAAVVFPRWFRPGNGPLSALDDSKKLTPDCRERLAPMVKAAAHCWAIASVEPESIDQLNIFHATMLAMNNAVAALPEPPGMLLVDGNRFMPALPIAYETVVKGDTRVFSIAAASVLAKTARDEIMRNHAKQYPEYGFERHFGYATKAHVSAIAAHGRSPIHRKSFRLRQLGEQ